MWDSQSEEVKFTHFTWYTEEGPLTFKDESELRRYWIDVLQNENDQPKLFLVDSRPQDKHVFRVKKRRHHIMPRLFTINIMVIINSRSKGVIKKFLARSIIWMLYFYY